MRGSADQYIYQLSKYAKIPGLSCIYIDITPGYYARMGIRWQLYSVALRTNS